MAYRKDYDARGSNAFLDERNLDFLIANAPLDKLHELMESSDYMTYDKLMALHSRLEKQPEGPWKNQVQKDLIDQAIMANNTFERYQNGEDYVFHMQKEYGTQFVFNAGYADIGEAQRDFDSTRDNIRKMMQEIARNPSPDVQEALKAYMDDRRNENARMHVYHEDRKRSSTPPLHLHLQGRGPLLHLRRVGGTGMPHPCLLPLGLGPKGAHRRFPQHRPRTVPIGRCPLFRQLRQQGQPRLHRHKGPRHLSGMIRGGTP